ncbi:Arc family DNA-binding protein [Saccharopolyspora shandongensis]|uniref:Arc family DNA-binding protein n=1 Tax=Saccharopolyspora shandongensis TaxID=418495 RepID=UPI0033E6760B
MVGMDHEVRVTLRMPAALHTRLVELAKAEHRSLNAEMVHLLEKASGRPPVEKSG